MGGCRCSHFAWTEWHPHHPDQFWSRSDASEATLLWLYGHCCFRHPDFYGANVLGSSMSQSTLSSSVSGPRPGENTWIWLIKIATGPLLVLVLILHLIVNHYLGSMQSGLMTYDDVVRYFQNPV